MHTRIMIIYDGVTNSVFESQVIVPLLKQPGKIYLISFEPNLEHSLLTYYQKKYPRISFIFFKRWPFLGTINLYVAAVQVYKIISSFSDYALIVRGPLAGFIAQKAAPKNKKILIQARGLLAQEYKYSHQNNYSLLHRARNHIFKEIEKKVWCSADCIEVVSQALKDYLITTYAIDNKNITIAEHDIPFSIAAQQKLTWRKQIRKELSIDENTFVYCYNGSAKTWQLPHQSVQFFKDELIKKPRSLLLILSHDDEFFQNLLQHYDIAPTHYRVLSVAHDDIYRYLAAADAGIIFRQKHLINWISRPTKILEYRALALPIIHNNTIAYLQENETRTIS